MIYFVLQLIYYHIGCSHFFVFVFFPQTNFTLSTTASYILGLDSLPETTPGETIYKGRLSKNLTLKDLGTLTGLHESTIKDYQNDRLKNKKTLQVILDALE